MGIYDSFNGKFRNDIHILEKLFLLRKGRNISGERFEDCQTLFQHSVPNELMLTHLMEGNPYSTVMNSKRKRETEI